VHSSVNKIRSPVNVVKVRRVSSPSKPSLRLLADDSSLTLSSSVDTGRTSSTHWISEWRVHALEWTGLQLRDDSSGSLELTSSLLPSLPSFASLDNRPKLIFSSFDDFQAHDTPIRSIAWARSSRYLLSSDDSGQIKYFQSNMNNLAVLPGHAGHSCRGLSFGSGDSRFVSAGDDGFIRIWGFEERREERGWRGTFIVVFRSCSRDES